MLFGESRITTVLDANLVPETVRQHPGMIALNERRFLYDLARTYYSGEGIIVDAGVFLGCSTACFANGVRHNEDRSLRYQRPVYSFDLAICGHSELSNIGYHKQLAGYNLKIGDSFAPILENLVKPYQNEVLLSVGDITEKINIVHDPIEVFFIDVFKTAEVAYSVSRYAFPKLIPNRSIVIHQDFYHPWLPWIHIEMGRLAGCFKYLGSVSCSAVYLCVKSPDAAMLAGDFWNNGSPEELLEAFDLGCSVARSGYDEYVLALARVILLRQKFGKGRANEYLATIGPLTNRVDSFDFGIPQIDAVAKYINNDQFWDKQAG